MVYVGDHTLRLVTDQKEKVLLSGNIGNLRSCGDWVSGVIDDDIVSVFAINLENGQVFRHSLESGQFAMNVAQAPHCEHTFIYIQWQTPFMPWDQSQLILRNHQLGTEQVYLNPYGNNVQQVVWLNDDELLVIAQNGNWWNLMRVDVRTDTWTILYEISADCGVPLWQMGKETLGHNSRHVYFTVCQLGQYQLHRYDLYSGDVCKIKSTPASISQFAVCGDQIAFVGGGCLLPSTLYIMNDQVETMVYSEAMREFLSDFESSDAYIPHLINNYDVQAWCYETSGSSMVISLHGGPTGQHDLILDDKIRILLNQNIGFCALDYRGSSGYGQDFRNSLYGHWGKKDVEDLKILIQCLRERYPNKMLYLRGNSAASWTCLLAASQVNVDGVLMRYPVLDPSTLFSVSHDFERGYLERLLGDVPSIDLTEMAKRLTMPILIQQGDEDPVVPAQLTREVVKLLQDEGVNIEYIEYPGQGHGFKGPDCQSQALTKELAFINA